MDRSSYNYYTYYEYNYTAYYIIGPTANYNSYKYISGYRWRYAYYLNMYNSEAQSYVYISVPSFILCSKQYLFSLYFLPYTLY